MLKLAPDTVRVLLVVAGVLGGQRVMPPAEASPGIDLEPLKAEIREQFASVRAEVRDLDRRLVSVERRP